MNRLTVPLRQSAAAPVMIRDIPSFLLALSSLAVSALLAACPPGVHAAGGLPVKESGSGLSQPQTACGEPQGRQMRRYQAFACNAELPQIMVRGQTTIEVGEICKVDASRLAKLSTGEVESLAGQFRVPAALITRLAQRVPTTPPLHAAQFARELRTAVIDYRFLQGEWGRYHPGVEGQPARAAALEALQAGDIPKAWALYDGLSRPQPPGNLRAVTAP